MVFELKAAQDTYKVSWVRLDDYFTKGSVLAVLVDRSAVMRSVKDGLFFIPAILVLFALLIGVGILQFCHDAQFRSDKGVLEIINGGLDYWFEVDGSGVPSTMAEFEHYGVPTSPTPSGRGWGCQHGVLDR